MTAANTETVDRFLYIFGMAVYIYWFVKVLGCEKALWGPDQIGS